MNQYAQKTKAAKVVRGESIGYIGFSDEAVVR